MAERIKETFGIETELIPGSGGIFDVAADGKVIFSRDVVGRFPDHEEVIGLLKEQGA